MVTYMPLFPKQVATFWVFERTPKGPYIFFYKNLRTGWALERPPNGPHVSDCKGTVRILIAYTAGNPFSETKLRGFSRGRGLGALKGLHGVSTKGTALVGRML